MPQAWGSQNFLTPSTEASHAVYFLYFGCICCTFCAHENCLSCLLCTWDTCGVQSVHKRQMYLSLCAHDTQIQYTQASSSGPHNTTHRCMTHLWRHCSSHRCLLKFGFSKRHCFVQTRRYNCVLKEVKPAEQARILVENLSAWYVGLQGRSLLCAGHLHI